MQDGMDDLDEEEEKRDVLKKSPENKPRMSIL